MRERNKEQQGPRRGDWLFVYEIRAVLDGAKAKLAYHERRGEFWRAEREKAVAAVKGAGFEVREYEVTGGKDVQVVVDQTLSARLGQCSAKIREHIGKIKEYRQWVAVLETQDLHEHIDLHMDDALYFGVAREKDAEEA
jgi:hypothetical protein